MSNSPDKNLDKNLDKNAPGRNLPEKYIDRLLETSNKKYKLLQDMLVLTKAQSMTITEEGLEGLERVVDEKQAKIEDINKIDEEFNVYFQRLKHVLKIKSLDELQDPQTKGVKELKQVIGQIMGLLNEIYEIENQNNIKAKKLLDNFANEINKTNQGKKINSTYRADPIRQPSYFIDKKK